MKLGDIYKTIKSLEQEMEIFGYSAQFAKDYRETLEALGRGICTEKGVNPEEAPGLPKDTELSSQEVVNTFAKLRSFMGKPATE